MLFKLLCASLKSLMVIGSHIRAESLDATGVYIEFNLEL